MRGWPTPTPAPSRVTHSRSVFAGGCPYPLYLLSRTRIWPCTYTDAHAHTALQPPSPHIDTHSFLSPPGLIHIPLPNTQVTESHQSSKADTSGTAKALVNSLGVLAGDVRDPEEVITMIRDKEGQVRNYETETKVCVFLGQKLGLCGSCSQLCACAAMYAFRFSQLDSSQPPSHSSSPS